MPYATPLPPGALLEAPYFNEEFDEAQTPWSLSSKYFDAQGSPRVAIAEEEVTTFFAPHSPDQRYRNSSDAANVCARASVAVGSGLSSAITGQAATFVVHGHDKAGRPVLSVCLRAAIPARPCHSIR